MPKTRTDLIRQALGELGLLAAGQTPSPEDSDGIDDHIDPLLRTLERRQIITVDDPDEIPDEWFLPLAVLLADAAASGFGLPGVPPSASSQDPVGDAETTLREVEYARPTYETQRTEYF